MEFLNALTNGRPMVMDGAMGTELLRANAAPAPCLAACNLTCPEKVLAVHNAYCVAGAKVLLTNTFQANPFALAQYGREFRLDEIGGAGVHLARKAAGPGRFVLGDVGPMLGGRPPREVLDPRAMRQTLAALEGVDGILFETWSSPEALRVVEWAFHQVSEVEGLPLLLSLTFQLSKGGKLVTQSGHGPETFARHAQRHGVTALGVNCGKDIGLDETVAILKRFRQATDLPLFARPNAGSPLRKGNRCIFPLKSEQLAEGIKDLLNAGACMVGGCCGTTPAHIAAVAHQLAGFCNQSTGSPM
jgi:methionine synthase I (cobalamin-dependent)